MSQQGATSKELDDLQKALNSKLKVVNIRLREGEYQFNLAQAIACFELEIHFPDVKELVKKLFGENKTEDPQFVSMIQTILKKMEKSGVVKILPKEKPWELQRYSLASFKFQDVEKNQIIFATKAEVEKTRKLIHSRSTQECISVHPSKRMISRVFLLVAVTIMSFIVILWSLAQPTINILVFILAFCVATTSSIVLGFFITREK